MAMIAVSGVVTNFTGLAGDGYAHTGQGFVVAAPSFDPQSASAASPWSLCSSASNRSYLLAALRAGVIALVLLGVLALIVLI